MRPLSHLFFLLLGIALWACNSGKHVEGIHSILTESAETISPYLTTDENGEAVLCWTEKDLKDSLFGVKYSHFNRSEGIFPEHHAVLTAVNGGVLLAWIKEEGSRSGINYSLIPMD